MDDLDAWLALARAPGLHAGRSPRGPLLRRFRQRCSRESRTALAALGLPSRGDRGAARARMPAALAGDERWLAARPPPRRLRLAGLPAAARAIPDAPLVLFVEGDAALLGLPQLAMVGARNPTAIGRDTADAVRRAARARGLTITSGLALGIDAASHRGALAGGGRTIAVLGCGPDRVYPARARAARARDRRTRRARLASCRPACRRCPEHFPRRNRIISGLVARHAGRRGGAAQRLADHRAARRASRAARCSRSPARSTARCRAAAIA